MLPDAVKTTMAREEASYQPLKQYLEGQQEDHEVEEAAASAHSILSPTKTWFYVITLTLLVGSNGILLWREMHRTCTSREISPYWGSDKIIRKPFHWATEYSDENKTETSPLWASLFPIGDGLVALHDDLVVSQQLPASMKRNETSTDNVYFVAAYHQLHCLTIIRSILYHLKDGMPLGVPFAHATHCLDSLRQAAMCHADDTLLYTEDSHTYGDGQARVCKDWDALAHWTREHHIYVDGREEA
ncbi:hypothetical protein F4677DRAFT_435951 [Hypoxylon crocopeplum]|nr:hypothetical protein F4677DRAFT_435951 [Hypoxylon crocopeplum]